MQRVKRGEKKLFLWSLQISRHSVRMFVVEKETKETCSEALLKRESKQLLSSLMSVPWSDKEFSLYARALKNGTWGLQCCGESGGRRSEVSDFHGISFVVVLLCVSALHYDFRWCCCGVNRREQNSKVEKVRKIQIIQIFMPVFGVFHLPMVHCMDFFYIASVLTLKAWTRDIDTKLSSLQRKWEKVHTHIRREWERGRDGFHQPGRTTPAH